MNKIKLWSVEDQPREKLLLNGSSYLTNAELLAILINSGNRELSAVSLCKELLAKYDNNLKKLARTSCNELTCQKGIGEAKASSIVAAFEIGRRKELSEAIIHSKISSSSDAYAFCAPFLGHLQHEEFRVLLLNRNNNVIKNLLISKGGVAGTIVDPKIIFKYALESLASGIILAHNHPSGNLKPSKNDISITSKLQEAGKSLDVNVLDHLIVSDSGYYSFADEGLI